MKHVGELLKQHIENNHLVKADIAAAAGISRNYLSAIFKQESCDAKLLEKLYVAAGLHPAIVFDVPEQVSKYYSDIVAHTLLGNASVEITQNENLRELLEAKEQIIAEKERTIQILLANAGLQNPGQNRDK